MYVIQAFSVSGVEESTTLVNEPTQNKTCYSGRFLDSLRSLGMTCRYVVSFNHTGHICNVAGGKIAAPTVSLVGATVHPYGFYSQRSRCWSYFRFLDRR